jgi:leader peptidase (prepilin peptidase) / N-methyltransferase
VGVGVTLGLVAAATWATALSVYDVLLQRLPNALTLPGAAVVLGVATVAGRGAAALLGAFALAALYLVVHLVAPASMGAGDVKLAIGLGGLTGAFGADAWVLAAVAAPVLTALAGVVVLRARGTVPHGPSMCVAALGAVALVAL